MCKCLFNSFELFVTHSVPCAQTALRTRIADVVVCEVALEEMLARADLNWDQGEWLCIRSDAIFA